MLDASHGPTPEISIISPVHRAAVIVPRLVERIIAAIETIGVSYEMIPIDDRSPDDSWPAIVAETAKSPRRSRRAAVAKLRQHNAISAGPACCAANTSSSWTATCRTIPTTSSNVPRNSDRL